MFAPSRPDARPPSPVQPDRASRLRFRLCLWFVILAALYLGWSLLFLRESSDGAHYYFGSRAVFSGQCPFLDANTIGQWQQSGAPVSLKPGGLVGRVFLNLPVFALLMTPVALLPWQYGIRGVAYLNLFSLFLCIGLLWRMTAARWSRELRLLFVGGLLLQRPTMAVLFHGQTTLMICALLAAMLYALSRRKDGWAGVLLGLALSKFTLAIPFLAALAYRRNWKATFAALAVLIGANALVAWPWGLLETFRQYRYQVAYTTRPWGVNDPAVRGHMDLVDASRLCYYVLAHGNRALGHALYLLFMILSVVALAIVLRPRALPERGLENPLDVAILAAASLTLFYHRYYDLAELMFVGYGLIEYRRLRQGMPPPAWKVSLAALLALSFVISDTSKSWPLDPLLHLLHLPRTPTFASPLMALLFVALLWLRFRERESNEAVVRTEAAGNREPVSSVIAT